MLSLSEMSKEQLEALLSNRKLMRFYAVAATKNEMVKHTGGKVAVLWLDAERGLYKRETLLRMAELGAGLGLFEFRVTYFSIFVW